MKQPAFLLGIFAWTALVAAGSFWLGRRLPDGAGDGASGPGSGSAAQVIDLDRRPPGSVRTTVADAGTEEPTTANPKSLKQLLEDARAELSGGMINLRTIVDVFQAMEAVGTAEMPAVMRLIGDMPNFPQKNLLNIAALSRWAESDGKAAAEWVRGSSEDNGKKAGLLGAVFSAWGGKEPLVAWDWFESARDDFANPQHEHGLMRSLFQGLAVKDFDLAMGRLRELDDFDLRTVALEGMGAALTTDARRDTFLSYVQTLGNPEQRLRALRSVLGPWAGTDSDAAAKWVESLPAGQERAEAAKTVGNAWFESAPQEASRWLVAQVPDDKVPEAIRDTTNRWLQRDPNAAAAWLGQFDPGPESDPARAAFSQGIAAIDPESALTWAGTIENPSLRSGSLVHIFKNCATGVGNGCREAG